MACAETTGEVSKQDVLRHTYQLEQAQKRASIELGTANIYGTTVFQSDLKLTPINQNAAKILKRIGAQHYLEEGEAS